MISKLGFDCLFDVLSFCTISEIYILASTSQYMESLCLSKAVLRRYLTSLLYSTDKLIPLYNLNVLSKKALRQLIDYYADYPSGLDLLCRRSDISINTSNTQPILYNAVYNGINVGGDRAVVANKNFPCRLWKTKGQLRAFQDPRTYRYDLQQVCPFTRIGWVNNNGCNNAVLRLSYVAYYEISIRASNAYSTQYLPGWVQCVAIGLCSAKFRLEGKQPGWDNNSIGYHSDDGSLHFGGEQMDFGPEFGDDDTVGCGIIYPPLTLKNMPAIWEKSFQRPRLQGSKDPFKEAALNQWGLVFFTKNGKLIGISALSSAVSPELRQIYAVVGIDSYNSIEFNFGKAPFKFDLEGFEQNLQRNTLNIYQEKINECNKLNIEPIKCSSTRLFRHRGDVEIHHPYDILDEQDPLVDKMMGEYELPSLCVRVHVDDFSSDDSDDGSHYIGSEYFHSDDDGDNNEHELGMEGGADFDAESDPEPEDAEGESDPEDAVDESDPEDDEDESDPDEDEDESDYEDDSIDIADSDNEELCVIANDETLEEEYIDALSGQNEWVKPIDNCMEEIDGCDTEALLEKRIQSDGKRARLHGEFSNFFDMNWLQIDPLTHDSSEASDNKMETPFFSNKCLSYNAERSVYTIDRAKIMHVERFKL